MTGKLELPFAMPKDFADVPPIMAFAFMPWMLAGAMMSQGIAFWSSM